MSIITRHAGAPFLDGEVVEAGTSSAPDELELDIQAIFNAINGNLDGTNFHAAADLQGSKVAVNTLIDAKATADMVDSAELDGKAIDADQIADGAVELDNIAAQTVSNQAQIEDDEVFLLNGIDWEELHTGAVLTGPAPNAVLVLFSARAQRGVLGQNWTKDEHKPIQWRLKRSGVTILTSEVLTIWVARHWTATTDMGWDTIHFEFLDTVPPANASVTYSVEVIDLDPSDPADWRFSYRNLLLWNLRR